ncbi:MULTISPECIES: enoyl-CoA hydratase-related protein [Cereibacter]|uniref:Enoyl-CoA hydratase/carnithine racemase n=1 Tax=Cereibacter johrii TaxID=445629 RepID=A0ABX5J5T6_9RHOB|nr:MULTISPECIES: enoyl-CoA hydratase-related protein [Cereibacter]RDS96787.1 enoyl-CoA hydratase [Cereibacter sphaeroides f. sp. denitrificans]MEA5162643.1 enoyl-CoA hydratase-related protein [Cereibacter johrii]ODM41391.1 enoyl-CoA hydratase [Cereibacter johrii]PTM76829.1 enoyl-CoA hydratase/carnithine racemase [Cereibacter johrii]QCP87845.1 enoyl-CoA hydratase [Cereibacter sphaeroides]
MDYENRFVKVSVDRGLAVVTLDRPPANAVSLEVYDEIRRTFHRLGEDPAMRVAVLTGAGKVFCGGNDVNDFVDLEFDRATEYLAHVRLTFNALYDCPIPVVGAINGAAVGTGIVLASLCDIRIASERAVFALPEIDVGVLGGSRHVMRLAGQGMTRWMMYTGRRVRADEALRARIVDEVVPPEEVMPRAMAIAEEIASKSPPAIRLAKLGLNRTEDMNMKEGYEFECTLTAAVRRTPEAREGAMAFLEKRQPSYAAR